MDPRVRAARSDRMPHSSAPVVDSIPNMPKFLMSLAEESAARATAAKFVALLPSTNVKVVKLALKGIASIGAMLGPEDESTGPTVRAAPSAPGAAY